MFKILILILADIFNHFSTVRIVVQILAKVISIKSKTLLLPCEYGNKSSNTHNMLRQTDNYIYQRRDSYTE